MPQRPRFCSICGRPSELAGRISTRGRCADCSNLAMVANTRQMIAREGPYYDEWVGRWGQALERVRGRVPS